MHRNFLVCAIAAFLLATPAPDRLLAQSTDDETSPSGAPIYRHSAKNPEIEEPETHARNLEDIEAHLEAYFGPIDTVFHEIVSDRIHLDVLVILATEDRPYSVLATSGVSDLPMAVPEGLEDYSRAELLIALPADWPLTDAAFEDEANFWPVRWLKSVGRIPHDYDSWLGWGHTIPNGEPMAPIADTNFIGVMLSPPYWLDSDFFQLEAQNGDLISFYEMIPLYEDEMVLKLNKGAEELERRLDEANIGYILDIKRPNVTQPGK